MYVAVHILCRPYSGDDGTVEIKIRDAVMKLSVLVTRSADGYPVMHTTKCVVILPSLSIDLHGSSRLHYSTFNFVLKL